MKTQRDKFFEIIGNAYKSGRKDLSIITTDMGAKALNEFKSDPNFLTNIGPAEQLGACMTAGLALQGFKSYLYGIVPFITGRCFEQISISVCSQNLPVTIIGSGASLSYDLAGPTHHGIFDLGIMRCLPNMEIWNISTIEMAEAAAKYSLECKHPLYIRLDKQSYSQRFLQDNNMPGWFTHNLGREKRTKIDTAIITTGVLAHFLLDSKLPENCFILEIFRFPGEQEQLKRFLSSYKKIITVEENYIIGGLGDYIASLGFQVTKIGFKGFCEAKPRQEYWDKVLKDTLCHL